MMMMRMLSAMGLAAFASAASVTASPTQSAGVVVGKMQELNLEQVGQRLLERPVFPFAPVG
jgi:hypothetical protein